MIHVPAIDLPPIAPESAALPRLPGLIGRAWQRPRNPRWRPGLAVAPHNEIFASSREASGAGLALALARDGMRENGSAALASRDDRRMVLWVQDREAIRRGGRPFFHGLPETVCHRLIHVEARRCEDALFAIEEGLRCRDITFVIGEIAGNPRALDFTASRRLSLATEKHGVPLWLVRLDAQVDLSSARMRWQTAAAQSPVARWNGTAPGDAAWRAELFRARNLIPGEWTLNDDGRSLSADGLRDDARQFPAADPFDLVRAPRGRSLATV